MTYLNYKKKIELKHNDILQINNYAKKNKIDLFASCFDVNSLKDIKKYKFKYNKIPSALITNLEFVKQVALQKKHTFISTGMCQMINIKKCVKIFKKLKCPFTILHCVSLYPWPEDKLNLNMIKVLKQKFKCQVGYSGMSQILHQVFMHIF